MCWCVYLQCICLADVGGLGVSVISQVSSNIYIKMVLLMLELSTVMMAAHKAVNRPAQWVFNLWETCTPPAILRSESYTTPAPHRKSQITPKPPSHPLFTACGKNQPKRKSVCMLSRSLKCEFKLKPLTCHFWVQLNATTEVFNILHPWRVVKKVAYLQTPSTCIVIRFSL